MTSIELVFKPWRTFIARKKPEVVKRWLNAIGMAGVSAFKNGMKKYPPASRPGAWPNIRSGGLRRSVRHVVTNDTVTIGTSQHYSGYLRHGTYKMDPRKMSDAALREGIARAKSRLGQWVEWSR